MIPAFSMLRFAFDPGSRIKRKAPQVQGKVCRGLVAEFEEDQKTIRGIVFPTNGVGTLRVVVGHPVRNDGAGVDRAAEHGLVQQFVHCPAGDVYIAERGGCGR